MSSVTTNAVTNGRRVLHALAVVLEAQKISVTTTSIIVERDGKKDKISLLEIVRAAQNSFDELERNPPPVLMRHGVYSHKSHKYFIDEADAIRGGCKLVELENVYTARAREMEASNG